MGQGSGPPTNNQYHALLWNSTADSVVDLHPSGFMSSWAEAMWGTSQVGAGVPAGGFSDHALLWNGTAASAIDLNLAGF
ncbi:MAG TPA: hypothetical protein VH107_14555, partial [Lacipirellulaceae bacterium]|nr:hypothetical protein [Lacipirellulaceae bacterium]